MKYVTTKAILLNYHDYGESNRLFTFFTRDFGKVTLDAKGARKSKKRHFTTIDLLSYMTVTFSMIERNDIQTLYGIDMIDPFCELRNELTALSAALYLAELVSEFYKDLEKDEEMFDELLSYLKRFNRGAQKQSDIIIFQLKVLEKGGLIPNLISCIRCDKPFASMKNDGFYLDSEVTTCLRLATDPRARLVARPSSTCN